MTYDEMQRCRRDLRSRVLLLGEGIRRRAAARLVADNSTDSARILAGEFLKPQDEKSKTLALQSLREMEGGSPAYAVGELWVETRSPELRRLIQEKRWIASQPSQVRTLTALLVGDATELDRLGAATIPYVAKAVDDRDAEIAGRAEAKLRGLNTAPLKNAACKHVLKEDLSPRAIQIILEAGHVPADEKERALFYFLTEQWDRCEALDFDHSMLRTHHAAAEPELRARITEKLRAAGRLEYLSALAGADYTRAAEMSPDEAGLLVQALLERQDWDRLWALVPSVSLKWSVAIVRRMSGGKWRPASADALALFQTLDELCAGEISDLGSESLSRIPFARPKARAKVRGRVNDLAFHPSRPLLAIGTGERRIGMWDLQRGALEKVLRSESHSIGRVAMPEDGSLLAAESTISENDCTLWWWPPGKSNPRALTKLQGGLKVLLPLKEDLILTASGDERINLWSLNSGSLVTQRQLYHWPRNACYVRDKDEIALVYRGASLVNRTGLVETATTTGWKGAGIGQAIAATSGAREVVIGMANGEVNVWRRDRKKLKADGSLMKHDWVEGAEFVAGGSVLVTAGRDGWVRFYHWPSRRLLGHTQPFQDYLTCLRTSPDGAFMAVGDQKANLAIWDLRLTQTPRLLTEPMGQFGPSDLALATSLEADPDLEPPVRRALRYLQAVLRHRFRYDVEIDSVMAIQAGEFDIEIQG